MEATTHKMESSLDHPPAPVFETPLKLEFKVKGQASNLPSDAKQRYLRSGVDGLSSEDPTQWVVASNSTIGLLAEKVHAQQNPSS